MNKEEWINTVKAMTIQELIEVAPILRTLADTATAAESLGKNLKGSCFNVIMTDKGPNKIEAIKAIRELTSLGLKESKDLVEMPTPVMIIAGLNAEQAKMAKQRLLLSGMSLELEIC